jgi:hypothetical protein
MNARLLLILWALMASQIVAQDFWQQTNGPYGGYVSCFAVSGTNVFAGTDGGTLQDGAGVFISSDNGASWAPVNTGLGNRVVGALAVGPNGAGGTNLFAGTYYEGGVFRSSNNGTSWTQVNTGLTAVYVWALAVNPNGAGGTNLFAGTEGGVFRTNDNAASWTQVNTGLTSLDVRSLAFSGANVFAGTYGGGVFRSSNSGISWTEVNTGLTNTNVFALAVTGSNLFAGTYGGGVFRSSNSGTSWTKVNTGLTNTSVFALAVTGSNLFAGTWGGVFLLTNNGSSWTPVSAGLTNTSVRALAVSGTNLFAATWGGGVFLSTNDGTSWIEVNTGLTNIEVWAFAISGANLFAGTNGGVFISSDNGASWKAVSTGLTNTTVYALAVSPNGAGGTNLFAGTDGGGVFRSTNNGASWTQVNTGLTDTYVRCLCFSGTNLYAGTEWGGVFLSTDNGTSWTAENSGLSMRGVNALAVSGTNLYAGTEWDGVFRSTDSGTSWTQLNTGLTNTGVLSLAVSGTNLFAGTYWGLYVSMDNGLDWSATFVWLSFNALAVSGTNLFAGAWGSGVYLSTDNGTSWTATNSGLTNLDVRSLAVSSSGYLYAGSYGGSVFRSVQPVFSPSATVEPSVLDATESAREIKVQLKGTARNLPETVSAIIVDCMLVDERTRDTIKVPPRNVEVRNGVWQDLNTYTFDVPNSLQHSLEGKLTIKLRSTADGSLYSQTEYPLNYYFTDFVFGQDNYAFPNPQLPLSDRLRAFLNLPWDWKDALTMRASYAFLRALATFDGLCFGMAASSIVYKEAPDYLPLPVANTFQLPQNDPVVMSRILAFHVFQASILIQAWQFYTKEFVPDVELELLNLKAALLSGELMMMNSYPASLHWYQEFTGPFSGHSVTAYGMLEFEGQTYVFQYDNNFPRYGVYSVPSQGETVVSFTRPGRPPLAELQKRNLGKVQDAYGLPVASDSLLRELSDFALRWVGDSSRSIFVVRDTSLQSGQRNSVDFVLSDSSGKKVGFEDSTYMTQIPTSMTYDAGNFRVIDVPADRNYVLLISGKEEGEFTLDAIMKKKSEELNQIYYQNISLSKNGSAVATFSQDSRDYPLSVDRNGDGIVDGVVVPSDNEIVTDVQKIWESPLAPIDFALYQNYPNPFNPSTTIEFALPKSSYVTLRVYDLLGRQMSQLVNQNLSPGTYTRQWDAHDLASGVYFYRLSAGDFIETKKLILLR